MQDLTDFNINSKIAAQLTVLNGKQLGAVFHLSQRKRHFLGRENTCNIQILDKGASRNHTLIEFQRGSFLLVDLGSTCGTFVNNATVISKNLKNGDIIKIGKTELLYAQSVREIIITKIANTKITNTDISNRYVAISNESLPINSIVEKMRIENSSYDVYDQDLNASLDDKEYLGLQKQTKDILINYFLTIHELSYLANAEQSQADILYLTLDKIIEIFQPENACVFLMHEKEIFMQDQIITAKNKHSKREIIWKTILLEVTKEGVSIKVENIVNDDLIMPIIKSVLCVPLEYQNKTLGAIYIDCVSGIVGIDSFTKSDLNLLALIGKQLGIAIERANLTGLEKIEPEEKWALNIIKSLQKNILINNVPSSFRYDLAAWNKGGDKIGGGYYNFFELPNKQLAITIGCITGVGIGTALLVVNLHTLLQIQNLAIKATGAANFITELNCILEKVMNDYHFMTLFYAEFDQETMKLTYANAGHDEPLLYRIAKKKFEHLEPTGIPLGIDDEEEYEEDSVIINKGDILILSTDGITEAMNHQGDQFGQERFEEVILKNVQKSANQIICACYDAVTAFCQGAQRNDLTLVVIKFNFHAK